MTLEMDQAAYGRPAADAFDLPLWLARREGRAADVRPASATPAPPSGADHTVASDALPPEFVPWSES